MMGMYVYYPNPTSGPPKSTVLARDRRLRLIHATIGPWQLRTFFGVVWLGTVWASHAHLVPKTGYKLEQ